MPDNDPVALAERLMGSPYLWGGKTLMGMDCSGLTQVAYSSIGLMLPRDAWQQAGCGQEVSSTETCLRGDLAFFASDTGRITHVGLCTGDGHIIHASGMVRRDRLDEHGIYDSKQMQYTHRLHSIRRIASVQVRL